MDAGIYKIECKITKKFYIGSSRRLKTRICEHKSRLRANSHQNIFLQRAWNKYGEDNFVFEIIEYVKDEDQIFDIEQSWLDSSGCLYNENGFNLSKISKGVDSRKISKTYIVTKPSGEEIFVENLSKFCREVNILGGGLHQVARGKINQCFGYKCRFSNETLEDWENKLQRSNRSGSGYKGAYLITHPNGIEEKIDSLNAFCTKHKLSQGSMRQVCLGNRNHYKGFKVKFIDILKDE